MAVVDSGLAAPVSRSGAARKRRIFFLTTSVANVGPSRALATLVERLDPARFDVRMCCFAPLQPGSVVAQLQRAGVQVDTLGAARWTDIGALPRLVRHLRRARIDVLHTRLPRAHVYGVVAARLAGVPSVVCNIGAPHSVHFAQQHGPLVGRLLGRIERSALLRATAIVAVSSGAAREVLRHTNAPPAAVEVIDNGIDAAAYLPDAERRREWRRRLGVADEDVVVGTVARLAPLKRLDWLVAAAPGICARAAAARFVVVGDGPLRNALTAQAAALGLADRMTWVGHCDDVTGPLAAMDLFVQTSHGEGMSNAMLEAMASGLPVVATAVSGTAELVELGQTGFLVNPADPDALVRRIVQLVTDPPLRRRFGDAARRRIRDHFTLERMVTRFEALYERLPLRGAIGVADGS